MHKKLIHNYKKIYIYVLSMVIRTVIQDAQDGHEKMCLILDRLHKLSITFIPSVHSHEVSKKENECVQKCRSWRFMEQGHQL